MSSEEELLHVSGLPSRRQRRGLLQPQQRCGLIRWLFSSTQVTLQDGKFTRAVAMDVSVPISRNNLVNARTTVIQVLRELSESELFEVDSIMDDSLSWSGMRNRKHLDTPSKLRDALLLRLHDASIPMTPQDFQLVGIRLGASSISYGRSGERLSVPRSVLFSAKQKL